MTSAEIRQSFLDFFKEKQHSIVPSASLMPQSPGLLFTNAGMNQFVPYFLGTEKAPYSPPRAADTQKCIRAGGKHNDLEDVGQDTYHHTFFEMLGNWSFGDYFKKEAIAWGWELVVERWGVPANRLYATVYAPGEGDPSEFDQEAYDYWAALFTSKGLDPKIHIVNGNVKDNFWMMGETGPCGPCSELHVDLTPEGDTQGKLVNQDSDLCIEIWNLVFIQYNAEADGSFRELPAKHVDTGMGFERACSLIQNTKGFTDFSKKPSNYATDVFQPIFRTVEKLSGKSYVDIYPGKGVEKTDALEEAIAFRVIADHIRTLSFSIADGILPGNSGRNYVLRRILRRAVKYGRTLGFSGETAFLPQLVDTLVAEFGSVFPELKTRSAVIKETLATEEDSFNKTLDRGLQLFESTATTDGVFPPEEAFKLYDTYGFPVDLTALLCRERGLSLDEAAVEACMEEQRERARAAQKKTVVRALDLSTEAVTEFLGFENDSCDATILEVHQQDEQVLVITNKTVFFTEMGGQEGDTGSAEINGSTYSIVGVQKIGNATAHVFENIPCSTFNVQDSIVLTIDRVRRAPIEAHHTATHLLHWALHKVVSADATQQGSSVSPERLRFDFNSKALTPEQIATMEEKVNACIQKGETVSWTEVPYPEVKGRKDIMQFFGDKYGDLVRVVQIGGEAKALNGYSMELCGGTHVRDTSNIGLFKIKSEGAIAAGVRRIEAVCGEAAWQYIQEVSTTLSDEIRHSREKLHTSNQELEALGAEAIVVHEMPNYLMSAISQRGDIAEINSLAAKLYHHRDELKQACVDADKALKKAQSANASKLAAALLDSAKDIDGGLKLLVAKVDAPGPNELREMANQLCGDLGNSLVVLGAEFGDKVSVCASSSQAAVAAGHKAGDIIRELTGKLGGKGGGKPTFAMGGAPNNGELESVLSAFTL
ncbi:alanine--tRNA ligase [Coraliomargarita parva]|uniref:alanine--tRNA ligase n=1 Tax=Coraliomargarita parva TaxID=3014050 RepID=UPI0022B35356|nr:alanine--tRNA ligase [Coraliomargarita parva]